MQPRRAHGLGFPLRFSAVRWNRIEWELGMRLLELKGGAPISYPVPFQSDIESEVLGPILGRGSLILFEDPSAMEAKTPKGKGPIRDVRVQVTDPSPHDRGEEPLGSGPSIAPFAPAPENESFEPDDET